MTTRSRFSPSPTGMIHLGNVRTAIFSALYAASKKGTFVLRIEDTDAARSEEKFVTSLLENLAWLSLHWQEGPICGGQFGPYFQSQRQELYAEYYQQLLDAKKMYPCFCSEQALALARKTQLSRSIAPRYSGTCKSLSAEVIASKIQAGEVPAWRFSVPEKETVSFEDCVKGMQNFATDDIGDFIIRRADLTSPFLFCNAIDDASMQITHVLRGEDHVANTPRQILILNALGLPVPTYGHVALIVGEDGAPLSKRHGSFSVEQLRSEGYLATALVNYLARLGHAMDDMQLLSFNALASHFQLEKLSRSPARFDKVQLHFWQKNAVQALSDEDFYQWVGLDIKDRVPTNFQSTFAALVKMNSVFPKDAQDWADIFFVSEIYLSEEAAESLRLAGPEFFKSCIEHLDPQLDLKKLAEALKTIKNISGKKFFMPLRYALTGRHDGPELAAIMQMLGHEKVLQRLHAAQARAAMQVIG